MTVFIVPNLSRRSQGLGCQDIVESAQHPARGGKRCRGRVVQGRRVRSKGPSVVGYPRMNPVGLELSESRRVDLAVGLRRGVAQMRVLLERRLDDARYGMAEGGILRQ